MSLTSRFSTLLLIGCCLCGRASAQGQTAPPAQTSRLADAAWEKLYNASRQASDDMIDALRAAGNDYITRLQPALEAALGAHDAEEAGRIKAEIRRIADGKQGTEEKPRSAAAVAARQQYDQTALQATNARQRAFEKAQQQCAAEIGPVITRAQNANDLPEAKRLNDELEKMKLTVPEPVPLPAARQPAFIVPVNARRVVFIVDATGSMMESFDYLRRELRKTVNGMNAQQAAGLVFLQEKPPPPLAADLLPMDREGKTRLLRYMDDQSPRGGTDPDPALKAAFAMHPDVILLLCDPGDFPDAKGTIELCKTLNANKATKIMTMSFGTHEGEATLKQIANNSGGEHRFVPLPLQLDEGD